MDLDDENLNNCDQKKIGVIQGIRQGIITDYQSTTINHLSDDDSGIVCSRASSSTTSIKDDLKNECNQCPILFNRLQTALAQTNLLQLYNISLQVCNYFWNASSKRTFCRSLG